MAIDTSREAVEQLAETHDNFEDYPDLYDMGKRPPCKKTAQVLTALLRRAEAAEAERDALAAAKWAEKHSSTMNDIVQMGMARDEAIAEAKQWAVDCEEFRRERDAALAEVARLSTPPDDAEVRGWIETLAETAKTHDDAYEDSGHLMDKTLAEEARRVSAFITRLSRALAAETAKREAMEADRDEERKLADDLASEMWSFIVTDCDDQCDCPSCKTDAKAKAVLVTHAARRKPLTKGCTHTTPCTCGEPE